MSKRVITVDDRGLRVPADVGDSCDVRFDGDHVWSFTVPDATEDDGRGFVAWPRAMRTWLDGAALVSLTCGGSEIFSEEISFGEGPGRVRFVDKDGIPVMIDKWGLVQRPFSGRGTGVVADMVAKTEEILSVLEKDCGIKAWMAFGTLLGAARSGKVIGHDSDIDLAYLSHQSQPAAMAREMFAMSRALRRHGMRVVNKSGSFITVLFPSPDGGQSSIDVYSTFYVGDLLHETATVRAPVPASAIEPLGMLEFEGRMLPAPADPDVVLTASYGESWRVPDPSFQHRPGPDIKRRFDGWFGALMRHRRDWERFFRESPDRVGRPSELATWALARMAPSLPVVDVGAGSGADVLAFARSGRRALGLDYARGSTSAADKVAHQEGLPASYDSMNLYDLRDVLSQAALVARTIPGPRVVYARRLLDSVEGDGLMSFWRFAGALLRDGGELYLEFGPAAREGVPPGRHRPLGLATVQEQATSRGGEVVEVDTTDEGGKPLWRMKVAWPR